jgi:hypothetical protein
MQFFFLDLKFLLTKSFVCGESYSWRNSPLVGCIFDTKEDRHSFHFPKEPVTPYCLGKVTHEARPFSDVRYHSASRTFSGRIEFPNGDLRYILSFSKDFKVIDKAVGLTDPGMLDGIWRICPNLDRDYYSWSEIKVNKSMYPDVVGNQCRTMILSCNREHNVIRAVESVTGTILMEAEWDFSARPTGPGNNDMLHWYSAHFGPDKAYLVAVWMRLSVDSRPHIVELGNSRETEYRRVDGPSGMNF